MAGEAPPASEAGSAGDTLWQYGVRRACTVRRRLSEVTANGRASSEEEQSAAVRAYQRAASAEFYLLRPPPHDVSRHVRRRTERIAARAVRSISAAFPWRQCQPGLCLRERLLSRRRLGSRSGAERRLSWSLRTCALRIVCAVEHTTVRRSGCGEAVQNRQEARRVGRRIADLRARAMGTASGSHMRCGRLSANAGS